MSDELMLKMAKELKRQHRELRTSTFLSLLVSSAMITRYLDSQRDEKEITVAGFNVLNTLILCNGSAFPTEISKKIFRSKHSVSKVIYTLESYGLITIKPVGQDRRKREVRITDKGIAIAKNGIIYSRKRVGKEIFSVLTEEEIKLLRDILKKIRNHTLALINSSSEI